MPNLAAGLRLKRINAAISASFIIPTVILEYMQHPSPIMWVLAFACGFVWANWFEYLYHRWLDHTPGLWFEEKHREHHVDPPDAVAVNLGTNGWTTLGMFLVNGIPMVALSFISGLHFAAPVMAAFVTYVLLTEEVHWRVHLGGWVPAWVRRYHLSHHGKGMKPTGARTKYNIFLPLFDWIFGTIS
jgi:hypothetical protein